MWTLIDRKMVRDFDGFLTDYSWYTDGERHVFVFGDYELYTPEDENFDWETESEEEAYDWFENYDGYEDEDDSVLEDVFSNAFCDNSGYCCGTSCPRYSACHC